MNERKREKGGFTLDNSNKDLVNCSTSFNSATDSILDLTASV